MRVEVAGDGAEVRTVARVEPDAAQHGEHGDDDPFGRTGMRREAPPLPLLATELVVVGSSIGNRHDDGLVWERPSSIIYTSYILRSMW